MLAALRRSIGFLSKDNCGTLIIDARCYIPRIGTSPIFIRVRLQFANFLNDIDLVKYRKAINCIFTRHIIIQTFIMNFLLFSGPTAAGKTPSIARYKDYLAATYAVSSFTKMGEDFHCLLIAHDRKIIFWSATDTPKLIDDLVAFIKLYPDAEAVVTSCRSYDVWPRQYQFEQLKLNDPSNTFFEIPMGRQITGVHRRRSLGWYLASILQIATIVGDQVPFKF
ncbi:hypothetical protein FMM05_00235 [Flavobacterium zepuense]|uniref:Uncharacterized protein n=1 Tax=Flavobacterium zepuense TaxID=2593302 RepID=A0A552V9H1_9FLAO|nr:hypothetical protein [Flavobacterium zepuense]TRW27114.1 hypothetical protein FMM05_00235 [Flavobacterium zepuense]